MKTIKILIFLFVAILCFTGFKPPQPSIVGEWKSISDDRVAINESLVFTEDSLYWTTGFFNTYTVAWKYTYQEPILTIMNGANRFQFTMYMDYNNTLVLNDRYYRPK